MNSVEWTNFLYWPAPVIALGAIGIGILTFISPALASKAFGLPATGEGLKYMPAIGSRDLSFGVLLLALCIYGMKQPIGYLFLALAITAVTDAVSVFKHGVKFVTLVHIFGAVFLVAYGAWFLLT